MDTKRAVDFFIGKDTISWRVLDFRNPHLIAGSKKSKMKKTLGIIIEVMRRDDSSGSGA